MESAAADRGNSCRIFIDSAGPWELGKTRPVHSGPPVFHQRGRHLPDIDLITPYCTRITVYDYAFLFTVFFLITILLLWINTEEVPASGTRLLAGSQSLAWSAWFTEFQDLSRNSLLYLAFLSWLTLTFFRDPINFCGFLLLAGWV